MHPKDTAACFSAHMGIYAIEPLALYHLLMQIRAGKIQERPVTADASPKATFMSMPGQTLTAGVVDVKGAITKKRSKFAETSAVETRALVRELRNDPTVGKIIMRMDTPGGDVMGIDDLAAEIREARKVKPVVAVVEDMCASAGYWLASQCDEIIANRSAFVGSLGAYSVLHDTSGQMEREGVKVHVVSSGGAKGMGVPGTPVTDAVIAEKSRVIEAITDLFKTNVRAGRGFTHQQTTDLFDGRVHMAEKALEMGLIDRIGSIEDALMAHTPKLAAASAIAVDGTLAIDWPETKPMAEFPAKDEEDAEEEEDELDKDGKPTGKKKPKDKPEGKPMPKEEAMTTPAAAIDPFLAECSAMAKEAKEAGCPLSVESIERKLRASGSMAEATKVYSTLVAMKANVGAFAPAGSQPDMAKTTGPEGKTRNQLDAEYSALVAKHRAAGKSLIDAVFAANKENPELHAAYLAAYKRKPVTLTA